MAHTAEKGARQCAHELKAFGVARGQLEYRLKTRRSPGLADTSPPTAAATRSRTGGIVQGAEECLVTHLGSKFLRILEHPLALVETGAWRGRVQFRRVFRVA